MKKIRNVRGILVVMVMMLSIGMVTSVSDAAEESTGWVTVDGVEGGKIFVAVITNEENYGCLAIMDAEESVTKANIPSEINGYQVAEVSSGAFYNCALLKSVIIPEGVTSIGSAAFENCENLTSVTLPSTIEIIESWQSFVNCPDNLVFYTDEYNEVVEDYVSSNLVMYTCVIGTAPEIPYDAMEFGWMEVDGIEGGKIYFGLSGIKGTIFDVESTVTSMNIPDNIGGVPVEKIAGDLFDYSYNSTLESLVIPGSVIEIGSRAFCYCQALETVFLGEGVEWIGNCAFYGCTALKMIEIPSTVIRVGTENFDDEYSDSSVGDVFDGCASLEVITVAEGNPVLASWEGMLFNKGLTYLYDCPEAKSGEVILPESVKYINEWSAFTDCVNLTKVIVNEGVTRLPSFEGCELLETLGIPSSVEEILYSGSFADLGSLKEINVAEDNTAFSCLDGALYSSDYQTLYKVPALLEESNLVIPEETNEIWAYALEDCYYLTTFSVEENNHTYMSIDGVLFSKDGKSLIKYPCGNSATSYVVPEGVTEIKESSEGFCGSYNLVSVVIPSTIDYDFEYYTTLFWKCENLERLTFAEGTERIEGWGVRECESLKEIVIPSTVTYIDTISFREIKSWGGLGDLIAGLTIYMYEESEYVKTYAENNGITYCLLDKTTGDLNGDTEMNVTDIMMIYKFINEVDSLAAEQQEAADVNGDGAVDVIDIMVMYKHINEVELLF